MWTLNTHHNFAQLVDILIKLLLFYSILLTELMLGVMGFTNLCRKSVTNRTYINNTVKFT